MPLLPPIVAALLTLAVVLPAELQTEPTMLLLGRFVPGGSWIEAALLAGYAAFLAHKLREPKEHRRWRPWLWRLFSLVFFLQAALGLAGFERFLMTGALHPPVPAAILAGPAFRGGGLFMVVLLLATLALVGPAWCSHLCYIGSWDDAAARARERPAVLPRWRHGARLAILLLVVATALGLRFAGVSASAAGVLALVFGLLGVALMLTASRRLGLMVHCVIFCPVGLVVNLLGKLSPFRLRIAEGCDGCGACSRACRYQALEAEHIARGRPGIACSLCGDCLPNCPGGWIGYRLPGLSPGPSRTLFLVALVSLHAAFMGLGRL